MIWGKGKLTCSCAQPNEYQRSKENPKAFFSLSAGILSFLYCLLVVINSWMRLSAFTSSIFSIFALPVFILSGLAIVLGCISIREISLSQGILKGKVDSIIGIVLGVLSFVLLLLPRISFIVYAITNPPNYEVVLQLQQTHTQKITPSILRETEKVISSRFRYLTVPHKTKIVPPDKIIVSLRVGDILQETDVQKVFKCGLLSFHLVHPDNENLTEQLMREEYEPPQGFRVVTIDDVPLLIKSTPEVAGDIEYAEVQIYQPLYPFIVDQLYHVMIKFTPEGRKRLTRVTEENIGQRLAIMVDETVYCTPIIREPITGGEVVIGGRFTIKEARYWAALFNSGPLPVSVRIIDSRVLK